MTRLYCPTLLRIRDVLAGAALTEPVQSSAKEREKSGMSGGSKKGFVALRAGSLVDAGIGRRITACWCCLELPPRAICRS
jgi:hypothetical protein